MKRNILFVIGGVIVASEIAWQMYKKYRFNRNKNAAVHAIVGKNAHRSPPINEVMFFTKDSAQCRLHARQRKPCKKANCAVRYLRNVVNYIDSAKSSLDVSVYFLTCQELSEAVINSHKRGVHVRVILDERMAGEEASQLARLNEAGVAVRLQSLDVLMHHKFVIIDREILIAGSTNWTMAAFFGNFENILVTNHPPLVQPFVKGFEDLWKQFGSPICSDLEISQAGITHASIFAGTP